MKTRLPIGLLAISLATLVGFTACKQEKLEPPTKEKELRIIDARSWDQKTTEEIENGDEGSTTDESGNIQLTVRPQDANATVRIYNSEYDSGEVSTEEDAVLFRYLPPGLYVIDITPGNSNYSPVRFENVEILVNTLTDLGEIIL